MYVFIGDPHGKFDEIISVLLKVKPQIAFFLGDLGLEMPFTEQIKPLQNNKIQAYTIMGNHDTDNLELYKNIAFENPYLLTQPQEFKDIQETIVPINGVFRGKIYNPRENNAACAESEDDLIKKIIKKEPVHASLQKYKTPWEKTYGIPLKHRSSIFPKNLETLQNSVATVALSHESPDESDKGFQVLCDHKPQSKTLKIWANGHHHITKIKKLEDFLHIQVGMRAIVSNKGEILKEEDFSK